jgi:hypothetical protein
MPQQLPDSVSATLVSEVRLVFSLILSVFLLTSAGFDNSEGGFHYMVAQQILRHGSLGFADPQDGVFTVAPNGRTYASHEIGNTLFMLPVAGFNIVLEKALANRQDKRKITYITGFFLSLMSVIYCAVAVTLLYVLLRLVFRKSLAAALGGTLAFAFCTFVWTYSRNLYDGVLGMALMAGAMLSMMQFGRTKDTRLFVLATTLFGFGVITRVTMVLPLVAFAVYLTIVFWQDRMQLIRLAVIGGIVLAPYAVWQTYYNHLRTGGWLLSPVQTAQYVQPSKYALTNGLTGDLAAGLTGYLFSPGKSIFLYVPLALLSIVCFRRFMARYPAEAAFVAVLSVLWLLVHAKLASWFGNWGYGPRYFVNIAPVLVLPACVAWEWMTENLWRRSLLVCALGWGALLAACSIIGNWHFRMGLAVTQGREQAMIWSLSKGQAPDMIVGAVSNLRNIVLRVPGPTIPGLSPLSRYASNTINVWINSAAYQGVPRILLAVSAFALVAVAVYSFGTLRQMILRDSVGEHHDAVLSTSANQN